MNCVVNFDKKRIRVYTADLSTDISLEFNPEMDDWQEVLRSNGYNPQELNTQVVQTSTGTKEKASNEDAPDLMDIINDCTREVREEGAHNIVATYIESIKKNIDSTEVHTTPDIEPNYALCSANYPKGITVWVPYVPDELLDDCVARCKALYSDLCMLYDSPAEIYLDVIAK